MNRSRVLLDEGFYMYKNQAFGIAFPNGYALEVAFGPKNYADNYNPSKDENLPLTISSYFSTTAEVKVRHNGIDVTADFFKAHMDCASINVPASTVIQAITIIGLLSE